MGRGEAFYSLVIRFPPFSEPVPLDCDHHKCFRFFSVPVNETEWLAWADVRYFPSPDPLGSDNTPAV